MKNAKRILDNVNPFKGEPEDQVIAAMCYIAPMQIWKRAPRPSAWHPEKMQDPWTLGSSNDDRGSEDPNELSFRKKFRNMLRGFSTLGSAIEEILENLPKVTTVCKYESDIPIFCLEANKKFAYYFETPEDKERFCESHRL